MAGIGTSALFAGQGAQFPGMGADLARSNPDCASLFSRADKVMGREISQICFKGPDSELGRSDVCQPAVFLASAAALAAFNARLPNFAFDAYAGLSLGEWTALYAAGVLSFDDALRILEARGRFMQEACVQNPGGMASVIGLSAGLLAEICGETGAYAANFNSPEQTVLSGPAAAVERAAAIAKEKGAKRVVALNVAGAYHSPLMAPAAEKLSVFLDSFEFKPPAFPVLSNVTGLPHESPGAIKVNMVRQVVSPVQWTACVEWMKARGIGRHIEFGPGRVLSGLVKRIDTQADVLNVQDMQSLEKTASAPWNR